MKSILYVGATLMIGASIYGFVDYKKTSRNKEFNNMYSEKEVTKPVPATNKPIVAVMDKEDNKKTEVKITVTKNNKKAVRIKKTRKFNTKLFSRGALDERYIEPVKEEKKSDN